MKVFSHIATVVLAAGCFFAAGLFSIDIEEGTLSVSRQTVHAGNLNCFHTYIVTVDVGFGERREAVKYTNSCGYEVWYGYTLTNSIGRKEILVLRVDAGKSGLGSTGSNMRVVGSCPTSQSGCYKELRNAAKY